MYVHSLDRFGRNKDEILFEWNDITKNIRADIVIIDMPLLDTTQYKDKRGTFIADLVLQILSWIAQDERAGYENCNVRNRCCFKNGVKFGRPKVEITNEFIQIYKQWKNKEISAVRAMELANIKKTTFYKLVKKVENEN